MEVIFDKRFTKDAKKIKEPDLRQKIKRVIERLEQADTIEAVGSVKKLQGHPVAP